MKERMRKLKRNKEKKEVKEGEVKKKIFKAKQ